MYKSFRKPDHNMNTYYPRTLGFLQTCKWLATFSLVRPSTFMTSRIVFGTAPDQFGNDQKNKVLFEIN